MSGHQRYCEWHEERRLYNLRQSELGIEVGLHRGSELEFGAVTGVERIACVSVLELGEGLRFDDKFSILGLGMGLGLSITGLVPGANPELDSIAVAMEHEDTPISGSDTEK